MNFKTQQDQFDNEKWYDSVMAGEDQCGTYAFCVKCNKTEEYPCAKAAHRHNHKYIRLAVIRRHK